MPEIAPNLYLDESEISMSAIRAQGSGGQNVNKVSSAIHLRFDISASSLPDEHKQKLLNANDSRINQEGVLVIKAQSFRTQEMNRQDALDRLLAFIRETIKEPKKRLPTKPSKASQIKRVDKKKKLSKQKSLRRKVDF